MRGRLTSRKQSSKRGLDQGQRTLSSDKNEQNITLLIPTKFRIVHLYIPPVQQEPKLLVLGGRRGKLLKRYIYRRTKEDFSRKLLNNHTRRNRWGKEACTTNTDGEKAR